MALGWERDARANESRGQGEGGGGGDPHAGDSNWIWLIANGELGKWLLLSGPHLLGMGKQMEMASEMISERAPRVGGQY
jgi:hypothetical protein